MRQVPRWPLWLGVAGLLPQVIVTAILALEPDLERARLAAAVALLYPTLILTFLGGTWWGIAAAAPAAERRGGLGWLWVAAVLPTIGLMLLAAASAIFTIPASASLMTVGAALLLTPLVDARLGPLAPRWWMALRLPLSLGLGGLTVAAAFLAPV